MTKRVVIGRRLDNTYGLFISAPGVDVDYASPDQLLLGLTQAVSQIVMIGAVPAGATLVPLGFSRSPFVILNTFQSINNTLYTFTGRMKPSPYDVEANGARAQINGNGLSMTVSTGLGCGYTVANAAYT